VNMSAGDVVCTGWLIKSPPEKKLKRYVSTEMNGGERGRVFSQQQPAWRKRWFVLRRGRMSGNPDVLEYYRNKTAKKPIRVIDLNECEVKMHTEVRVVKREFQNHHVFVVKTSFRTFYLVAKTEEEMNNWVHNISQICHFGPLDDTASVDSLSQTPSSQQPSPAIARVTDDGQFSNHDLTADTNTTEESRKRVGGLVIQTLSVQSQPAAVYSPSSVDSYEDSYVPMNPGASPPVSTPLSELPADLEPPPVNRDLKPRRRARPPPLDLRGLSTIRENSTHVPLTRALTEPWPTHCVSLEGRLGVGGVAGEQEDISTESKQLIFPSNGTPNLSWPRKINLDYLSLDFNSASPSPVQKKPLLADEHRVDYVQVDEKKTQALQNTKMEWKDVRQSKV
ncbi:GAB3 protein, partial [Amia calva]|nr:GAB3 protein [Amia calva]